MRPTFFKSAKFFVVPLRRASRRRVVPIAPLPFVEWNTKISVEVKWGNLRYETNYKMYEHRLPVRLNSPQALKYTFRDQYGNAINLSLYTAAYVAVKRQDDVEETFAATITDVLGGKVQYDNHAFEVEGIHHIQFVVSDAGGTMRWGDPAQVNAAKNVPDLAAGELMTR